MWYFPPDLNRQFASLDRLADGMLGFCGNRRHQHPHHPHHRQHPHHHSLKGPSGDDKPDEPRLQTPNVSACFNEEGDGLLFYAELPGIEKKGLNIEATSSRLTLKGEGKRRRYETVIPLRHKVRPDSAKADLKAGLLTLELKLQTPLKEKATKIEVA